MVNENVRKEIEKIIEEYLAKKKPETDSEKAGNLLKEPVPKQSKETKGSLRSILRSISERSSTDEGEPCRNYYSYPDQPSQNILVQMNRNLLNKAKKEASRRQISLSSYIRECLMYRLHKASPRNSIDIDSLLKDCTKIENGQRNLVIEGEQGFLAQIKQRGLTGSIWTPSQLDKVAFILGREHARSIQEKCIEEMKLDKVQTQYFRVSMFVASEEKTEEAFYMPHGICDKCHRPLRKDQYTMSGCPYCGHTKGREFLYDEKVLLETFSNPYAMCSNVECQRPLPKEASKWKCCPYCKTEEEQITLNYEGILEKTSVSEEQNEPRARLSEEESETED